MAWYKRKEISMALTALIIVIFLVDWNFDIPQLKLVTTELSSWGTVIGSLTIGLGYINMFQFYGKKVTKKESGWMYSAWLLVATVIVSILGIIQGQSGNITSYIYNNIIASLDSTFFSLAVFYMASASYRAFRFRNVESSLLLICAFIVLLKNAPIGAVIWPGFSTLGTFLMDYPTMAVGRGITITAAIGGIALAVRILTGKEYGYLAGTSE